MGARTFGIPAQLNNGNDHKLVHSSLLFPSLTLITIFFYHRPLTLQIERYPTDFLSKYLCAFLCTTTTQILLPSFLPFS
jgi:hypothetical protein